VSAPLTVGVEEEFLLLDPVSWRNAPVADEFGAAFPRDLGDRRRDEFRLSMAELVTPVCTDLATLRHELSVARTAGAEAASAVGARLVAIGATPYAEPELVEADKPRFHAIARHYGPVAHDPAVCGCHVHIGVPDRRTAIQVCNRIRVWLPVLQAIAVNSPFHAGADTGYASWRNVQLDRWPSLGPAPWLASEADYDGIVGSLVASGVMLDPTMVLWYARPSAKYPTVEVRVADVCSTVDDAVLLAALTRAMVATPLDDGPVDDLLLSAAHWNAAHTGLDGTLLDPRTGSARPAWDLVCELLDRVSPALQRHGDLAEVHSGLDRLRREGTGAARQRRIFAETGSLGCVLAEWADRTAGLARAATGTRAA
jgi:YbdK family carboxylate-amine ligase